MSHTPVSRLALSLSSVSRAEMGGTGRNLWKIWATARPIPSQPSEVAAWRRAGSRGLWKGRPAGKDPEPGVRGALTSAVR